MTLASFDMQQAAQELREAAEAELPRVKGLREKLSQLPVCQLGYRQCLAVAPVATDGGENRLSFEPLNIEIIRVVDSEGREHLQKFIPLSAESHRVQRLFEDVPLLRRFLSRLEVGYEDLSYFLPGAQKKAADELDQGPMDEDLRKFVRSFRDIAEWAVLLELAYSSPGLKVLVIRDGLLRSKSMTKKAMQAVEAAFRRAHEECGSLLVGVAKRSKVLSYLSLALALEGTLRKPFPCFIEVPLALEQECYNFAHTWMQGHAFGAMHLVKLAEGPDAPMFPVDIPTWLLSRRKEILEYLVETARASFPTPGYPQPLVRAHENANLRGLEMSVLGDLIVQAVADGVRDTEVEKVLRHVALGRGLVLGGTKFNARA